MSGKPKEPVLQVPAPDPKTMPLDELERIVQEKEANAHSWSLAVLIDANKAQETAQRAWVYGEEARSFREVLERRRQEEQTQAEAAA